MKEEFKIIIEFDNYSISNFGNVKNNKNGKFLKQSKNSAGYKSVTLSYNNIKRNIKIHQLVAETFMPNLDNKLFIEHIDGNVLNNHIENLRYVENSKISSNNYTPYNGVNWNKTNNKWNASIKIDGKKKCLGYFDNIDDAIKARKEFENKIYCEYDKTIIIKVNININQNNTLNDLDKEIENLLNN